MIVIDHYGIDYTFEKQLSILNSQLSIMVLDDTYEKHHCDILLNHNISADKKKYKGLVPKNCKLKCGSKYTLLRDEFIKEKKKQFNIQNCPKEIPLGAKFKIFLAMGGADTSSLNIPILKVLKKFDTIKVNLVTTTANKNLVELKKYCKNKSWINLHINSSKIAKLMAKSDLAIITPSVTANEVYYLSLAMLAIKTASNQNDMYNYLKKRKFLVLSKFTKNKLTQMLKRVLLKQQLLK
jgi:UDP-2,4-diacetamido-2,4,6-trideoxy-beta-L-altropyranose hydrolase